MRWPLPSKSTTDPVSIAQSLSQRSTLTLYTEIMLPKVGWFEAQFGYGFNNGEFSLESVTWKKVMEYQKKIKSDFGSNN